jgi:hypothetical protein
MGRASVVRWPVQRVRRGSVKASVGKLMCSIGVHRWVRRRNPEGGANYLECGRCRRQKDTITLNDIGGGGFG